MKKAVVSQEGQVINVIEIEEGAIWSPPEGMVLVSATDDAEPGGSWDGRKFIRVLAAGPARLDGLHGKLAADTITPSELREMLRLERGL